MKKQLIMFLVTQLSEKVITDDLKEMLAEMIQKNVIDGIDYVLDKLEDKVEETHNTIDDAIVLPVCEIIRIALNIPDND